MDSTADAALQALDGISDGLSPEAAAAFVLGFKCGAVSATTRYPSYLPFLFARAENMCIGFISIGQMMIIIAYLVTLAWVTAPAVFGPRA
jgi:hypothetical protein